MHKFVYFGDRSKHKANVITVAYIREDNILKFEYSCSCDEDIYNKEEGKKLAVDRLSIHPIEVQINVNVYVTIATVMLSRKNQSLPSWARKLLKVYLNNEL